MDLDECQIVGSVTLKTITPFPSQRPSEHLWSPVLDKERQPLPATEKAGDMDALL
jgi:hypothetical protein